MNNEQLITTQSQSLAERPQVRLQEVLQAGETNEISFVKNTFSQTALRQQRTPQTIETLALVLAQSAVLAGIKDGVQDVVKKDLKELIFGKFGGLSLEEIAYAFKLERQLAYPTETKDYQFFSTKYVAEILGKYTQWKAEKRRVHNLDPVLEEKQEKSLSDEDKVMLFFTGVMSDFEYFKTHKKLDLFASRHYYPLYHLGLLPKHDEDFRQQIKARVLEALQKDLAQTYNRNERIFLKQIIESQMTQEGRFKTKAHECIVGDFFQKVINEDKNISDILKEKTNGKSYAEIVQMIKY